MKALLLSSLICLSVIATAQSFVTVYDQCNYGGRRYELVVGNYRSYQMLIGNDKLSSLKIPSGLKVTLYEHDNFAGRSTTYTSNISCLPSDWIKQASSMVVESQYGPGYNENDYVVFYNDCYGNGYSQTLRPGQYTGAQLGALKQNISSFTIYGNLRVRAYLNNDNLSGYSVVFDNSQFCLTGSQNDKIASLIIETKTTQPDPTTGGGSDSYIHFYSNCNYEGNSIHLGIGRYEGDKLGMFKNDISSMEIPSTLQVRVYVNNEYLSGGNYYTLTDNSSCLSSTMNNRIGSLIIEPRYGGGSGGNPNTSQYVIIYTDTYHQGQSASLLPGNYATMAQAGFPDDALSSLVVPQGYRAILYEHPNFGGKSYTITQTKTMFTISGWNDKTSSIKIIRD